METASKPQKEYRTGCLIPLGLYLVVLVIGYFVTRPPMITADFSDSVASRFSVATVAEMADGFEYSILHLSSIRERHLRRPVLRFMLPEPRITINVGDIHHARILEDHGDWQLIEFSYSNTYMATSIYRAYFDRVEPVSFQVTSSVGDVFMVMLFTGVAVGLYLLAAGINFFRNRRARKYQEKNRG